MIVIAALLAVAAVIAYVLLASGRLWRYYGLGKLTGSRLDIGPVDWATLTRHATQTMR